jgi:hypothetical protein
MILILVTLVALGTSIFGLIWTIKDPFSRASIAWNITTLLWIVAFVMK